jgi:hypothetical protein
LIIGGRSSRSADESLPVHIAIAAGRKLCERLLEPLQATFGRLAIRSAYRAPVVNEFGNRHGLSCASNLRNYGRGWL